MKPYIASLANAIILIAFGLWGYYSSETPSPTAFIPVILGGLIAALNSGVKKENKVVAHIVVVLTLVVLVGLIKPLTGAIGRNDNMAIFRVITMLLSSIWAMVTFVQSFIAARRK
jgi:hypothetical protein